MVVGGLPSPSERHAEAIASMALDMQSLIGTFHRPDAQPLALRIGIHTGPVVAGVIGRRKFIYDLWGHTVNVASRLESGGLPGRIQVSEAVADLLRHRFGIEPRGSVPIKGVGTMSTYWLGERRP
jgi:class 3 adenylate cyclase